MCENVIRLFCLIKRKEDVADVPLGVRSQRTGMSASLALVLLGR